MEQGLQLFYTSVLSARTGVLAMHSGAFRLFALADMLDGVEQGGARLHGARALTLAHQYISREAGGLQFCFPERLSLGAVVAIPPHQPRRGCTSLFSAFYGFVTCSFSPVCIGECVWRRG